MGASPACNVTKRQLMPPPRLPRHLRPCRPLWSAHQVRFASDKPSSSRPNGGGDAAKSPRSPERTSRQHLAWRPSVKRPSLFAGTAKTADGPSKSGQSRGDSPPAQPAEQPAASARTGVHLSQAQRMRRLLNGGAAADASAEPPSDRQRAPGETTHIQGAITTYTAKKDELQQTQQSGTSTETEAELRERVKKLEEQLTQLHQKLEASGATEQPPHLPGSAHGDGAAADARSDDGLPTTPPDAKKSASEVAGPQAAEPRAQANRTPPVDAAAGASEAAVKEPPPTRRAETVTLAQQIQAQSKAMKSSSHPQPARPAPSKSASTDEVSEQSLLDELFPEASSQAPPVVADRRPSPPKLDLPATDTNPHIRLTPSHTRTAREMAIDAFRARGEQTTVLQLSHCSTALTEADFRRLIPRGLHIETWSRDGEFYKIIPGRDPLSLARLPFYYLLFHSPASALAYQKNASRLSKLRALYAPSSIHSAVMPPTGFLEHGEDLHAVTSSFVLHPQGHQLDLRTLMQPYNRALRTLIDAGGYAPIVPNVDENGKKIHRVLLHIDGYEPSHWDLWQIISRHAHARGILWPFRNEHASAVRRLRDCINLKTVLKTKFQAVSTANPRAASPLNIRSASETGEVEYEDPQIASFLGTSQESARAGEAETRNSQEINQLVMNRVYNRWIVEFDDEDAARRFAGLWHRVVLPDAKDSKGAWKEAEEERWVEAEYLW